MYKFKKGDRVRVTKLEKSDNGFLVEVGDTGTVLEDGEYCPWVEMDKFCKGHDANGLCKDGHGRAMNEEQIELITDYSVNHVQPLPNTITLILGNTAYEITGENITIKTKQL